MFCKKKKGKIQPGEKKILSAVTVLVGPVHVLNEEQIQKSLSIEISK